MKTRKFILRIGTLVVIPFLVLTACETREDISIKPIEGSYQGIFTRADDSTNLTRKKQNKNATATVRHADDGVIEVHFHGQMMDTTMMLNYYDHHDNVMVCLTGDDFENMYGHMSGDEHMSDGMMDHMNDGETEWMHHMNEEHQDGDEHFGGVDMNSHTFDFQFRMMDDGVPYYLNFQGVKQ
ncbi:MAG: hypothetical protein R6U04_04590 [Bacteroidales bacterium]